MLTAATQRHPLGPLGYLLATLVQRRQLEAAVRPPATRRLQQTMTQQLRAEAKPKLLRLGALGHQQLRSQQK